jgi:cysteinyl-tRNA synthetase
LIIQNTLTGKKEEFTPINPGKVRIYVCGITVYDYLHLGHARMLIVFDMVVQYLRMQGLDVTYIRNITDIDDKIINRANVNGESFEALTARFIQAMNEDAEVLGMSKPDLEPRATQYIPQIITMIGDLLDKGYAYQGDNGDVFYDVSEFSDYGQLSGKRIEDLRAGDRVEVQEAKHDPLDFVLWKMAKEGEPFWGSPWGDGRPGWHIECSAMSTKCLGTHFDIHGGGQDLQFPHHENEIAQSCAANDGPFVNLWMHNGFVRVDDEKMSKSLDNFFTVREILKTYQAEVIRFFILSSHYRSPLNYSDKHLDEAKATLDGLYLSLRGKSADGGQILKEYVDKYTVAMDDDFNTPKAIALMHEIARDLNKAAAEKVADLAKTLIYLAGSLGFLQADPDTFLKGAVSQNDNALADGEIEALILERNTARAEKNFTRADEIRDIFAEQRIVLEDGADGTTWRRN